MKRTGSIGSRVPPADTTTRRPASVGGVSTRADGLHDGRGLGQAALAQVAAGEAALGRGHDVTPRPRSVARLSCTAGCSHISVCMAGQTTTGARVASRVAVSRSLEMPAA